ncbi:DUF397 domain-containing protein [Saccharopolyspora sp. MS10]|uniref:DUF397 domain-containing protein n=1 Tax=Saccharopolyspora sp. MS10 TaxID=3385973 RepID=UPI0039A38094
MTDRKWRKSSWSNAFDNCVEVALSPEVAAVRDSKAPEGGHVAVPAVRWGFFLQGLKTGRFDR